MTSRVASFEEECPTMLQLMHKRFAGLISEGSREEGRSYQASSNDVFLVSFPRCGAEWVATICHLLRSGGDCDFDDISEVVPWDVLAQDEGRDLGADQGFIPKLILSHESAQNVAKGGRYIYVCRQPENAMLAFHKAMPGWLSLPSNAVSLEEFYDANFHFGADMWTHLSSWWKMHREDPNTLWICYENLMQDLETQVRLIASFLQITLTKKTLQSILRHAGTDPAVAGCMTRAEKQSLPAGIVKDMHARWGRVVFPNTNCASYQELRAAVTQFSTSRRTESMREHEENDVDLFIPRTPPKKMISDYNTDSSTGRASVRTPALTAEIARDVIQPRSLCPLEAPDSPSEWGIPNDTEQILFRDGQDAPAKEEESEEEREQDEEEGEEDGEEEKEEQKNVDGCVHSSSNRLPESPAHNNGSEAGELFSDSTDIEGNDDDNNGNNEDKRNRDNDKSNNNNDGDDDDEEEEDDEEEKDEQEDKKEEEEDEEEEEEKEHKGEKNEGEPTLQAAVKSSELAKVVVAAAVASSVPRVLHLQARGSRAPLASGKDEEPNLDDIWEDQATRATRGITLLESRGKMRRVRGELEEAMVKEKVAIETSPRSRESCSEGCVALNFSGCRMS